jgi:hypothetical protein
MADAPAESKLAKFFAIAYGVFHHVPQIAFWLIPIALLAYHWQHGDPVKPVAAISLPAEVQTEAGWPVSVNADTTGKKVSWRVIGKAWLFSQGHTALVGAPTPGTYEIMAWTAIGNEPTEAAICILTVGQKPPVPGPVPQPDDPLVQALQDSFKTDGGTAEQRDQLADVYAQFAKTVQDQPWTNVGQIFDTLHLSVQGSVGDGLKKTRESIGKFLSSKLPTNRQAAVDQATKDLCSKSFIAVSKALKQVK